MPAIRRSPFDGNTCRACGATVSGDAISQDRHISWHERLQREQTNAIDRAVRQVKSDLSGDRSRLQHILAWLEHYGLEVDINEFPPGYGA